MYTGKNREHKRIDIIMGICDHWTNSKANELAIAYTNHLTNNSTYVILVNVNKHNIISANIEITVISRQCNRYPFAEIKYNEDLKH